MSAENMYHEPDIRGRINMIVQGDDRDEVQKEKRVVAFYPVGVPIGMVQYSKGFVFKDHFPNMCKSFHVYGFILNIVLLDGSNNRIRVYRMYESDRLDRIFNFIPFPNLLVPVNNIRIEIICVLYPHKVKDDRIKLVINEDLNKLKSGGGPIVPQYLDWSKTNMVLRDLGPGGDIE